MNSAFLKISVSSLLVAALVGIASAQQVDNTDPAAEPKKKQNDVADRKSIFEEPTRPPYTDPFFPQSKLIPYRAEPTVVPGTTQAPVTSTDQIFLKGTDGKRLALINRKTFAVGESGTIKTARGPVNIELLEVKEASAIIKVENDPTPKEIYLRPEP